jgi:intraflagellar transport protein 74
LAEELKELQGTLGDYNTLLDKIHSDSNLEDIERQYEQLKVKTEQDARSLNDIFTERQRFISGAIRINWNDINENMLVKNGGPSAGL